MSSETVTKAAIRAHNLGKRYTLFDQPLDRLKQLFRPRHSYGREFWALRDLDFEVGHGEVPGIVGRNGAGKSTLLQLLCGTLEPTTGSVTVGGRVAALLELGAGFNPEFSGRENIFLNGTILGLNSAEIAARYDDIVAFSGIGDFIDQPVKTYSSGMYVRLAFAVAISVDPDILIIDEALSVGDGEFARKSFDRIMDLKDAGKTILFCSHSMYQIEAICNRALWLNEGRVQMLDVPARVVSAYDTFLARMESGRTPSPSTPTTLPTQAVAAVPGEAPPPTAQLPVPAGTARILTVTVSADGESGRVLSVRSRESDVSVTVAYRADPSLPPPTLALAIFHKNGTLISSTGNLADGVALPRDADGFGQGTVTFPAIPLLKGDYTIKVFLLCERSLHIYDHAEIVAELHVSQQGLEQGLVMLPHLWQAER